MKCLNEFNCFYYDEFNKMVIDCRNKNNTNLMLNYKRVSLSIKKYPFPILSAQQVFSMDGIGEATSKIFERLVKNYKEKIKKEKLNFIDLAFVININYNEKGKKKKAEPNSVGESKFISRKKPLKNIETFSDTWTAIICLYLLYFQGDTYLITYEDLLSMANTIHDEFSEKDIKIKLCNMKSINELKSQGLVDSVEEKKKTKLIKINEHLIKIAKIEIKKQGIEMLIDDEGTISFSMNNNNCIATNQDSNDNYIDNNKTKFFNNNKSKDFLSNFESKNNSKKNNLLDFYKSNSNLNSINNQSQNLNNNNESNNEITSKTSKDLENSNNYLSQLTKENLDNQLKENLAKKSSKISDIKNYLKSKKNKQNSSNKINNNTSNSINNENNSDININSFADIDFDTFEILNDKNKLKQDSNDNFNEENNIFRDSCFKNEGNFQENFMENLNSISEKSESKIENDSMLNNLNNNDNNYENNKSYQFESSLIFSNNKNSFDKERLSKFIENSKNKNTSFDLSNFKLKKNQRKTSEENPENINEDQKLNFNTAEKENFIKKSSNEMAKEFDNFLNILNSKKSNNIIDEEEDYESFALNIKLLIDNREKGPKGEKLIDSIREINPELNCEDRVLAVGDFMWIYSDPNTDFEYALDYIIERKTLGDLAGSIKDGRYIEQKHRLKNTNINNVYYLFEGNNFNSAYVGITKAAVFTAILNTFNLHDINIIKTSTFEDSLIQLNKMDKLIKHHYYLNKENLNVFNLIKFEDFSYNNAKTKNLSDENIFLKQLRSVIKFFYFKFLF